jgi:anaerobic selenocysteine-containing dehydrogenase
MSGAALPTICSICDDHCGILVADDGRRAIVTGNREHPVSKGFICGRGKRFGDAHYAPDRLTHPLLKTYGAWKQIGFEQALDTLASRLQRAKDDFGPESTVFYKGEGLKHFEVAQYMRHLANGFGSPNYVSVGSLCHYAQVLGHSLVYGAKPVPDFHRARVTVIWGANPAISVPRLFGEIRQAIGKGMRLVVMDPSRTRTAEHAHAHLQVRPGSDGFLALAFLKHAIEEEKLSPEADTGEGWDDLCELLSGLSYSDLLARSEVPNVLFDRACDEIFNNMPGWTMVGLGLEHRPGGVQAIRAAASLQSILDPENKPSPMAAPLRRLPGSEHYPTMRLPLAAEQYPLFTSGRHEGHGMKLTAAVIHHRPYPIRAMLVAGGDPMVTFPSTRRQAEILGKLDFLAVFDLFMTPTARLADLVFPAADQFDNLELYDYGRIGRPYLGLMRPVSSSPKGWTTWRLLFELARRLGLGHLFPWEDNREAISYRLSGTGVSFDRLDSSSSATMPYRVDEGAGSRWHMPDGKVHYRSHQVAATGNPPLPTPESLSLPSHTDESFPFWLSTGDRAAAFQHGQFRSIAAYRERCPHPLLEVHPSAAHRLSIGNGDLVVLSTRHGTVEVQANLSDALREDCLRMTHGWQEANVNELTGLDHLDPLCGFPWLKALPARVERA